MKKIVWKQWYASEEAKRSLGTLCRAVQEKCNHVGLLGSEAYPLVWLSPANQIARAENEVSLTIEMARADWSAVMDAVVYFRVQFRIGSLAQDVAVLRPTTTRPKAFSYFAQKPTVATLDDRVRALEEKLDQLLYKD